MRLAVLFFGAFLASGVVLLAVTLALWQGTTNALTAQPVPSGGLPGLATGVTQHGADRHQLLIAAGLALAITAAGSLLLGWLAAGRLLAPIRRITATTTEVSAENLHERLNFTGRDDELKELADTFDALLERLERSFAFERQFVANAAHEMRTPLAAMRASLDVAMAKPEPAPPHMHALAERLRRELDHADRLVDSFLALAQAQQGPLGDQSTVALAELAGLALERRADAITRMDLDVQQHRERADARVTGNATLLSRLVANVIDNAIVHNQSEGWVRVSTASFGHFAQLVVENSGPLLQPDEVGQLMRPFRRAGAERTGSHNGAGLGLAIVSSIVEVHGGSLQLEARSGGGLRVTTTLAASVAAAGSTAADSTAADSTAADSTAADSAAADSAAGAPA